MNKPVKYTVFVRSESEWYPIYFYKTDAWFIRCMSNFARFSPSLKVKVRVADDLADGQVEWFTVRFNQNGLEWELQEDRLTYTRGI